MAQTHRRARISSGRPALSSLRAARRSVTTREETRRPVAVAAAPAKRSSIQSEKKK